MKHVWSNLTAIQIVMTFYVTLKALKTMSDFCGPDKSSAVTLDLNTITLKRPLEMGH